MGKLYGFPGSEIGKILTKAPHFFKIFSNKFSFIVG
jgi:hypothetical protein